MSKHPKQLACFISVTVDILNDPPILRTPRTPGYVSYALADTHYTNVCINSCGGEAIIFYSKRSETVMLLTV